MNSNFAEHVIEYWFGDLLKGEDFGLSTSEFKHRRHIWSEKDSKVDQEITDMFSVLHAELMKKAVHELPRDPKIRLAAIIVLDQFSRHIFRDKPQMYAQDSLALEIVRDSLKAGHDQKLPLIARMFFYMPLMHSENISDHETIWVLFKDLQKIAQQKMFLSAPFFEGSLGHAQRHRDVILKFGRYPHRNKILGRPSSSEELIYLEKSQPLF